MTGISRTVSCPSVASTTITYAWAGHRHESCGGRDVIGLRSLSEIALLRFDLAPLENMRPVEAVLRLHRPDGAPGSLPVVGISTIRAEWHPGTAKDYTLDPGASSYEWAQTCADSAGCVPWAGAGTAITDVAFGNAGSRRTVVALPNLGEPGKDGWWTIPVPGKLVAQMQTGFACGLVVMDEKGQREVRTRPHSVHSDFPPTLEVTAEKRGESAQPPALVKDSLRLAENGVDLLGQLQKAFEPAFEVYAEFNGTPLELWRLPSVPEETSCGRIDLSGIIGKGGVLSVQYAAMDGTRGEPSWITVPASVPEQTESFEPSEVPSYEFPAPDVAVAVLFPGESLDEDGLNLSGSKRPAIWIDSLSRTLSLQAFRGEILDLNIAGPGGAGVSVHAPGWIETTIEAARYVMPGPEGGRRVPDRLEPDGRIDPGVKVGLVVVDLLIPKTAVPGKALVEVRIAGRVVPVEIEVLEATLGDALGFVVDLNSYGRFARYYGLKVDAPEEAEIQLAYHRLAHRHRCNFNVLPYTQMGDVYPDCAPALNAEGRIADWRGYDERNGPLLDGSAFAGLPRAGTPVAMFYLPLFEDWPGTMERDYRDHVPMGNTKEEWFAALAEHAVRARPIAQAFAPGYAGRLECVARDFAAHLLDRGWTKPAYISYWNNKHLYKEPTRIEGPNKITRQTRGTSWWCLDEPVTRDDFLALKYFGDLCRKGFAAGGGGRMDIRYCIDISRPQWDFGEIAGTRDMFRISSEFFRFRKLVKQRIREGTSIINYGGAHSPAEMPMHETLWCWRGALLGAEGILPWSATPMEGFSNMGWLEVADPLSVLCPSAYKPGSPWVLPTLRLKAFRRGQQDAEFLLAWSRKNPGAFPAVLGVLAPDGAPAGPEDAAVPVRFKNPSPQVIEACRCKLRRKAAGC
ncbi:MAG: hypothetical protein WCI95_06685 [bacterium]